MARFLVPEFHTYAWGSTQLEILLGLPLCSPRSVHPVYVRKSLVKYSQR